MTFPKSKQSGFTLVEIAIVLVIIGILLAGVLKGQSLINNSRIKGLVSNMDGVSAAYNGYVDRYQVQPGTETLATTAARGWATTVPGSSPLPLSAATLPPASTFATVTAQTAFWQVLKASGFFVGNANDTTNPLSSNGGLIGVTFNPYTGVAGVSVCLSGMPALQAAGVDAIVDGPLPANNVGGNIGTLRGAANAVAPLAPTGAGGSGAAYNEATNLLWTLCRAI